MRRKNQFFSLFLILFLSLFYQIVYEYAALSSPPTCTYLKSNFVLTEQFYYSYVRLPRYSWQSDSIDVIPFEVVFSLEGYSFWKNGTERTKLDVTANIQISRNIIYHYPRQGRIKKKGKMYFRGVDALLTISPSRPSNLCSKSDWN